MSLLFQQIMWIFYYYLSMRNLLEDSYQCETFVKSSLIAIVLGPFGSIAFYEKPPFDDYGWQCVLWLWYP